VSALSQAEAVVEPVRLDAVLQSVDERTREILEHRRARPAFRRRGWLIRRTLLAADVVGLTLAFTIAMWLFGSEGLEDAVPFRNELLLFVCTLPAWVVLAKLHGLYERDEERTDHSTVDDVVGVLHLTTIGAWLFFAVTWATGFADPNPAKLITFWTLALAFITIGRSLARARCRSSVTYIQNTLIVGAGVVGQLIARKIIQHPEYGLNLVGFADDEPRERRSDLRHLALLGSPDNISELVSLLDVDRVVIAFSNESVSRTLELVRLLRDKDVQIDIVPRLYDVVGPKVGIHTIEGLPLMGLAPARLSPSSRMIKRAIDVVGALIGLALTAPLFLYAAWRIHRGSPGPVFFRQTRLGMNMRPFTAIKFRTMSVGADNGEHRDFIKRTMSADAELGSNGIYKLDRDDAVTPFGRWLRKTSLDELPQLLNVLRGDMSLVGPRPCIPYETENFKPHHFERFLVPAGLTGLWQVTARAKSTFGEALDMDVTYARGWTLGLDLRLMCRTPLELLRQRARTA
jgi:exopolysaccharide biosynthesis polyprenyl glycosylphosphotransferase